MFCRRIFPKTSSPSTLGPLADGNKNLPAVYRDPEQFFRASYLTTGLKSLLQDVLSRLAGGAIEV